MDNIQVYNYAVPAEEITDLFLEGVSKEQAGDPVPADLATDVLSHTGLTWKPGEFAQTHTVYMSDSFDDVNEARVSAIFAQGLDDNTVSLENLKFYWVQKNKVAVSLWVLMV